MGYGQKFILLVKCLILVTSPYNNVLNYYRHDLKLKYFSTVEKVWYVSSGKHKSLIFYEIKTYSE